MKILISSTYYYPYISGGAEISTQIMAEGLASQGHDIEIITNGLSDEDELVNGVIVHRRVMPDYNIAMNPFLDKRNKFSKVNKLIELYREFFFSKTYYSIYKSLMKKKSFDVVHASGNLYCMGRYNFWKAALALNIPVSQAIRDPKLVHLDFLNGKLDRALSRVSAQSVNRISSLVAPSKYMMNFYNERGVSNSKEIVIPNAVEMEFIQSDYKNKENIILYVGRIADEKGILTLVNAMKEVGNLCELHVIGSGSALDQVNLPLNVKIVGFLKRDFVYEYMKKSKAVILPSEWSEAFGRTIIEAVANGTIPIGSDSGAIPEILDEGYIFKAKNTYELSKLIKKVVNYDEVMYINEIEKLQGQCQKYKKSNYIKLWENFFISEEVNSK